MVDDNGPDNRTVARPGGGRWADRAIAVRGTVVVTIPLLALVASFVTYTRIQESSEQARVRITGTLAIQKQLGLIMNLTVDNETGARGFLLTRDPAYVAPFENSAAQLPGEVARLAQLVPDEDAMGNATVDELRRLVSQRIEISERLRNTDPGDRSRIVQILNEGKTATDGVRGAVALFDRAANGQLAAQQAEAVAADRRMRLLAVVSLLLGFAGAAALVIFLRSIGRRVRLLRDNAEDLADGLPLTPLPETDDEIGQLAGGLAAADSLLRLRAEELRAAGEAADQANRAKTEFLSRMSHELRTPLNAMLGFAQILELESLSEDQHDDVEQILRGGTHLLNLVNEVLDISRIETGDLALSIESIVLHDVVHETLGLLQPLAARRGIRIVEDASVTRSELVLADRQRLTQILLNLISNAIKYNHEGGTVIVAAGRPDDDRVRITVTDTGPGIADDNIDLLFAPFERLGAERSDIEGTGIGLALSRRLAEAMAGTVEVDSRVGQGSTFWIELPAVDHSSPGPDGASPPALTAPPAATDDGSDPSGSIDLRPVGSLPSSVNPTIVLCIDDNVSNIRVVEVALHRLDDLQVISAGQGRLGVDLAREHHPSLILLDLHLPDLTGNEVLWMLKGGLTTADIPVIVVSADATPGAARRLLEQGAVTYLTKPVDIRELIEWVKRTTGAVEATTGGLPSRPVVP